MSRSKNGDKDLRELFLAMGSRDADLRYYALVEAQTLPLEQLTRLVRSVDRPTLSAYLSWRSISDGVLASLGACVLSVIAASAPILIAGLLIAGAVLLFFAVMWDHLFLARNRQVDTLLRVLANRSDRFCVESALLLLGRAPGGFQEELYAILLHRLPKLRAADAQEWTGRQKEPLKNFLRFWYRNEALAHCILQALPEIGGAWALPSVERLAKLKSGPLSNRQTESWEFAQGVKRRLLQEEERVERTMRECFYAADHPHTMPAWRPKERWREAPDPQNGREAAAACRRIGEAAAECLLRLQAKIQVEEEAALLLRAAALGTGPAELLHPVEERADQGDAADLLRAVAQPTSQEEPLQAGSR